jgi:hypothetical protein
MKFGFEKPAVKNIGRKYVWFASVIELSKVALIAIVDLLIKGPLNEKHTSVQNADLIRICNNHINLLRYLRFSQQY